jgi:hypothetical protein
MKSRGFESLRAGSGDAIAVRDDNRMSSYRRLDAAEEEIVVPAASKEKERKRTEWDSPNFHVAIINNFAIQSQGELIMKLV